jgi:hypothetical protein
MATEKPKTETFHVYGKDIVVELDIQYDASLNKLTLKPGQILLRDNLFLMEYVEKNIPDKKEADKWMYGILHEIIHLHCRTDPDVILSRACPNFEEYLINLAQEMAKTGSIPYVNEKRINSKRTINEKIASKKAANFEKEATQYGTITLIFTVNLQDIIDEISGESAADAAAAAAEEGVEEEEEGEGKEEEEEESEEGEEWSEEGEDEESEEGLETIKLQPVPPELDYIKQIYIAYREFTQKLKENQKTLVDMVRFNDKIPWLAPSGNNILKQYNALINLT